MSCLQRMWRSGWLVAAVAATLVGTARLWGPGLFTGIVWAGSCPRDPAVGDVTGSDLRWLRGRKALVVGGTRGIGRGVAGQLSLAGATVTVVGRTAQPPGVPADLSRVQGAKRLVAELAAAGRRFDVLVLTVGSWPDYTDPFSPDGHERVIQLDLLAHHAVLRGLIAHGLLAPGARVVNTIASTQHFPFVTAESVRWRLEHSRTAGPGLLPLTLFPVAVAGDAWLRAAAVRFPQYRFVGMFPGVVVTELAGTSFPWYVMPLLKAAMAPISISEEECGLAHAAIVASTNVDRKPVSYFNHLREARLPHPVALDDELSEFVYRWLEENTS